jgi:hypothetical protein
MYFSGGTARVYKGSFQTNEVAIKFLFCIELTPDRIVDFCNEATMLNSLQHPNIVTCYGVAIMPPAISLVTEFCHYGSLFDFLHSLEFNTHVQKALGGTPATMNAILNNRGRTSTAGSSDYGAGGGGGGGGNKSPRIKGHKGAFMKLGSGSGISAFDLSPFPLSQPQPASSSSHQVSLLHLPPPPPLLEEESQSDDHDHSASLSSSQNRRRASTDSRGSKSNKTGDSSTHRVSFQDKNEISFDDTNNNSDNNVSHSVLKFLDISAIDNVDAASRLAEALAHEYNAGLSYRASRSAHFSKANVQMPPWMGALSAASRKISRDTGITPPPPPTLPLHQTSIKMKTPASLLLTKEMGWGLGPSDAIIPSENILKSPGTVSSGKGRKSLPKAKSQKPEKQQQQSYKSRGSVNSSSGRSGRLISSGGHSMHSIGAIIPLSVRLSMMKDCVAGLAYLHSQGIMHCDIKSLNFLGKFVSITIFFFYFLLDY